MVAVAPANERMRVDGTLDEAAWRQAVPIALPYETHPGDNTPARVETTCRITFDTANLYFACEAHDGSPDGIRAYVTDRDQIETHDFVALRLDPFNDSRRTFVFAVNPLGVQWDGTLDEQQGFDRSWDAIWASAGRITDDGYVVEAAIPFKSLRFPADASAVWRFLFIRELPRSEQISARSAAWDRGNSCELCQTNLLTGLAGIVPSRNVELTPTVTSSRSDRRDAFPDGPLDAGTIEADAGVDARWSPTPNLTVNATVNPDFSQVEADAARLDVNERFALFFPERRSFFLEGADLFSTPLQAVFTRTIADPIAGGKVTGKLGRNALGVLVARDELTNLLFAGSEGSSATALDAGTTTMLARFRRDLGSASTVGALYTGREGEEYRNRVGGVDAFVQPFGLVRARAQYLYAATDYPDSVAAANGQGAALTGHAVGGDLLFDNRIWAVEATGRYVEPGFRADAGFVPQVGVRGGDVIVRYNRWGGPGSWFTRWFLSGSYNYTEDFQGRLLKRGRWVSLQYRGPLQIAAGINPIWNEESFGGETFDLMNMFVYWQMRPSGNVYLSAIAHLGEVIDVANVRKAYQQRLSSALDLRLGRHVDVGLDHDVQRLSDAGRRIFTAHVLQSRVLYHFTPRAFVRAIVQYSYTSRDPTLYAAPVDRTSRQLFSQFLFSYKVNPQTVIFLGYSDDRAGLTPTTLDRVALTLTGRTFFLKLSYAWRP